MIIQGLLDVVYNLFALLLTPINIPAMPDVMPHIESVVSYISSGLGVLSNFVYLEYFLVLFGIVFLVDAGVLAYKLVMFFLRKIPMLGIE